ncbi:unnamed protein product [Owenia fusiformis]|uniref:Uncharacterized protein n=2 Tax=Owenia fusiformis TaxID=6347 RepID=A0A8S4NV28_OWEFU|nr:unnamed protein product [Owenia fusiformis]
MAHQRHVQGHVQQQLHHSPVEDPGCIGNTISSHYSYHNNRPIIINSRPNNKDERRNVKLGLAVAGTSFSGGVAIGHGAAAASSAAAASNAAFYAPFAMAATAPSAPVGGTVLATLGVAAVAVIGVASVGYLIWSFFN